MKAVIMAGGEGTRLRPITLGLPKPMVPLFDKPVMEHIVALLKRHGVTDICVTLQYMPEVITNWFGDGSELGVALHYFVEKEPLGTAGSVKNCMPILGDDDFLVVSGDAVCDLDLSAAMGFHKARRSDATLVLVRHPAPLEYGLVLTDDGGRIERFIEKPGWGQVFANTINTGIYVLTRKAMDRVPDGKPYDFGRDLFPRLLSEGAPLYGHVASGYWCDMGDCAAYLDCAADALARKVELDLELPELAPGIWSASTLPESVSLVPPCWIGRGVTVGEGSLLGPHAILGEGSSVGKRSLVQKSILMENARAGDRVTLYGAILCRDADARGGSVLNEGTVLGAGSALGENTILMEKVKVWPGRETSCGARLTASLVDGGSRGNLSFGDGGAMRGTFHEDVSPELLMTIGGVLGGEGKVGLGWSGGEEARLLARAAGCGISAAGGVALVHDGGCPAAAAWLAARYDLSVSLFVEGDGERVYLHYFDRRGLPLGRSRERKLEGAVLRGEVRRARAGQVGEWENVTGVPAAYTADLVKRCRLGRTPMTPVAVSVPGGSAADALMVAALEELGCVVLRKRAPGVPGFAAEYGGLRLIAWDEEGKVVGPDQILALVSYIEVEHGGGRVAIPDDAPAAIDALGTVLRLGRDGKEAEELYLELPWLRDAAFAAARICARLGQTGERLRTLEVRVPRFVRLKREVPLHKGRGEVMQGFAARGEQMPEGVRIQSGESYVYLAPLSRRAALRVIAEAADMETARELCDFYVNQAKEMDGG
ncbi:MAG: hypothetical protein EOM52_08640 [Clostridia bacterium]|nr:hypothetical protein [Clostridia bacterium]